MTKKTKSASQMTSKELQKVIAKESEVTESEAVPEPVIRAFKTTTPVVFNMRIGAASEDEVKTIITEYLTSLQRVVSADLSMVGNPIISEVEAANGGVE